MADKLADELLRDILAPLLAVPDASFDSTEVKSPFSRLSESTSTFLVVCKRWMRIATPLLYQTVILRSTAQAQVLAAVLKNNKGFGDFIRKLRVEGAFGVSVGKIIQAAPNITDFCMTLKLFSDDRVTSMCKAMPQMDPTRVIVIAVSGNNKSNASTREATDALRKCLKSWPRVVSAP